MPRTSETVTENLFRDFYGPSTFIEKSAIPKKYGFKSKQNNVQGVSTEGYPDFFLATDDYLIVVEAKATVHKKAQEEVQFYMLNNKYINKTDIIGIAISGQDQASLKVSYFYKLKGSNDIKKFGGKTLLSLNLINEKFLNIKNGDMVSDEELTTILTGLNKSFHDNKVRDTDRSLFFSGIMIALTNSNFLNTYKNI